MRTLSNKTKIKTGRKSSTAYQEQVARLSARVKPVAVDAAYRPSN
jgi:hypothetical protein